MKKHSVILGLFVLLLTVLAVPLTAAIPPEERAALIALYNATNGDSWLRNSGWKEPPLHTDGFAMPGTENNWYGITVSSDHVYDITFYNNNLNGTIPSELGNLNNLSDLKLSLTQLTGSIPPELGNLNNLIYLHLNDNQLTGSIPSELGNLSKLLELSLNNNRLSSIPSELGNLGNLEFLYLNDNLLTSIPPDLGNLSNLRALYLYNNQLTSIPSGLENIIYLIILDLSYNQITGIPPEIGNFMHLRELDLSYNQITDIPPELGNLNYLRKLWINNNQLSGSIPPELGNIYALEGLYLQNNRLSGSIPPELGNLGNLEYLYLYNNQLSGSIPKDLVNCELMKHLYLYNNQLTGSIPSWHHGYMKNIDLSDNQLSGDIPNIWNVEQVNLSGNQLTGSIPANLGKYRVWYLGLSDNRLSGAIPPALGNLENLHYLDLSNNQLDGSIPSEIGNIAQLLFFKLNGNQLHGEIPTSLMKLTKLQPGGLTDIGYNILYTNDDSLRAFLNSKDPDWENTQTLAPGDVSAAAISSSSIRVSWTPINYNWDSGGYEVYYSTSPGGPWTYAGITADKSISSYDVTGLNPVTTYYFVVKTRTNPHDGNPNTVISDNSEEASATTPQFTPTYTLTLQSSPDTGVNITVTPNDNSGSGDGATNFTRIYNEGTTVTLTAPATHNGKNFVKWIVDGVDNTNQTIQVTMDNNHTVTAIYEAVPGTYTLTLQSSPDIGVNITVTPNDNSGSGDGVTNFTRIYNEGTPVTLTAPVDHNGKNFVKWIVDGVDNPNQTIQVTMDNNHTVTAIYEALPGTYTLTLQSSPDTGVNITVTPNDNSGNGDGTTNFTRVYNEGTVVTLTAPAAHKGKNFLKWTVDGTIQTKQTIQVTMNSNHTVTALYEGEPVTYTLTIQSSPGAGVNITVTPNDNNGNGSGITNFTRTYSEKTTVTLTAPATHEGKNFSKWTVDGTAKTNPTIQVTMNSNRKVKAYYTTPSRPGLVLNRSKLNFGYTIDGELPPSQAFLVTISGDPVDWTATTDVTWLQLSPFSGSGSAEVSVSIDPIGLTKGTYKGTITVSAPEADNSPQSVKVKLMVYKKDETTVPFGEFATPVQGAVVCSSIPVTGWALDDIGVDCVKIYRDENGSLVFIGDAVFVEGARPDVEQAYPDYPNSHKAGWGYMMLTNFLPNGGNGTFHIHAVAADIDGNSVTLGIKTITCDNANAVKPFGAIDTPGQGGTASGSNFLNWAWVLAPRSKIPADGSTINVYVDGVNLGHPVYNIYRSDIAVLFPGYANSNGAVGYFYLDTTAYGNGVHTMQWTATDSVGNTDGIGSRYFLIENTTAHRAHSQSAGQVSTFNLGPGQIPVDYLQPIKTLTDYNENRELQEIYPDENGVISIEIEELERLEIQLQEDEAITMYSAPSDWNNREEWRGFLLVGDQLRRLPIGSTLDTARGVFYWQPGPGFMGEFRFVFIEREQNNELKKRDVNIIIKPKH